MVGIFGNRVLWYNDIEEGSNVFQYADFETISDYVCNQHGLHEALGSIQRSLDRGDPIGGFGPPMAVPKLKPRGE